jgi:hypothetical protein
LADIWGQEKWDLKILVEKGRKHYIKALLMRVLIKDRTSKILEMVLGFTRPGQFLHKNLEIVY